MRNQIDISGYLVREEVYDASSLSCFAFRHGYDVKDGVVLALGNMVSGYPFEIQGVRFHNSECAYIAGAYSDGSVRHQALQEELADCTNGFLAKKAIHKPNEAIKRADWEEFNMTWMLYVVWMKCLGNGDFRKLLLSLPSDAVIIEDSTFQVGRTATVWGTRNMDLKKRLNLYKKELKAQGFNKAVIKRMQDEKRLGEWSKIGRFVGKNVMGKILMLCRDALLNDCEPCIDYALLKSMHIDLLGNELSFNQYIEAA